MTRNAFSGREAVRAAVRGSVVARALAGAARRLSAAAGLAVARVMVPVRWVLAPTGAADELIVDHRALLTMLDDGWIVQRGRSAVRVVARRWRASATAGVLARLRADIDVLAPAERVRLFGIATAAALTTHAALTRLDLLVERSRWLVGWLAVLVVAAALIRYPAAIAAAWSSRTSWPFRGASPERAASGPRGADEPPENDTTRGER